MTISVNGVVIPQEAIEREAVHHAGTAAPGEAAARALAIRELLMQRARALGLDGGSEEAMLDQLFEREVAVPQPTEAECRRYYDSNRRRFRSGERVEASHILFAVTPNAPLNAIRAQAEAILKQALSAPERFGELAERFSNCPSAAQGGDLGELGRGDTVREFEAALFDETGTGVLRQLVNTRYGFHVVRVARRTGGSELPFTAAAPGISRFLSESVRHKALRQYIALLAAGAEVTGVELETATSPLVQ